MLKMHQRWAWENEMVVYCEKTLDERDNRESQRYYSQILDELSIDISSNDHAEMLSKVLYSIERDYDKKSGESHEYKVYRT